MWKHLRTCVRHATPLDVDDCALPGVQLDLETVAQADVPEDAVVLLTGSEEKTQCCPPELAVRAIESALTPKKFRSYREKFSRDADNPTDPVYTTWKYLKTTKENPSVLPNLTSAVNPAPISNLLVKTGVIPQSLVDIFPEAPGAKPRPVRLGRKATVKARVLTSEEIIKEMHEHETKKRNEIAAKEERKRIRLQKKQLMDEQSRRKIEERDNRRERGKEGVVTRGKRSTSLQRGKTIKVAKVQVSPEEQRNVFFSMAQSKLTQHSTFGCLKQECSDLADDMKRMDLCLFDGSIDRTRTDNKAKQILRGMEEYDGYQPIPIFGDGNCFPRCGSMFICGHEDRHVEMRVRIAVEMAMNDDVYLDDALLSEGATQEESSSLSHTYAMLSDFYIPGVKLSPEAVRSLYASETMEIVKPASYRGMWQLHALASVLGSPVQSVYPGATGSFVTRTLNRRVMPISSTQRHDKLQHIMWTSTHSKCYASGQDGNWFQPNHFVPLLQPMHQVRKQQKNYTYVLRFFPNVQHVKFLVKCIKLVFL